MHHGTEQIYDTPLIRIHLKRSIVINELPNLGIIRKNCIHSLQFILFHAK